MKKKKRELWSIETIDMTPRVNETDKEEKSKLKRMLTFAIRNKKRIAIAAAVCYVLFFVLGLCTTRFYTDENGKRQVYRMNLSDLKLQDDYKDLKEKLTGIRGLLVDITIVDIHLANGDYTTYEASTMYTKILNEQLDVMIPKVGAMNLQDDQEPIRKAIESILTYDLALYLQNISAGLNSGNAETVNSALLYRDKAFATYEIIESDIRKLADKLRINAEEYFKWDLKEAVVKKDSTATLKGSGVQNDE